MTRSTVLDVLFKMAIGALATVVPVASTFAQATRTDVDESWWAAIGPDGVQRVNVRCGPNFLDPRNIVVHANVPLEISVNTTNDLVSHNFTLTMGTTMIDTPVDAAQKSFLVSPRLSGRFQTVCRDRSMSDSPSARRGKTGTITVVP
jgi:hypothetical protein